MRPSARPGRAPEARSSSLEHRHLRWRAGLRILRADGEEAHAVAVLTRHARRPVRELLAGELEPVIGVPEALERLPQRVVLGVRGRHDDGLRPRGAEYVLLDGVQ